MVKDTFDLLVRASPGLRRFMIRRLYQMMIGLDRDAEMIFMNYGYADGGSDGPPLDPGDEPNRLAIQLYDQLVAETPLQGRRVLEVGSGRGGGGFFLARRYQPAAYLGVDISGAAVQFCQERYPNGALRFRQGDAEALPVGDAEFDVVINLESSHGYGSLPRFLGEVRRVLRPGGWFLYADHRNRHELPAWRQTLLTAGFHTARERDITAEVVRALELDHERKRDLIDRRCPRLLRNAVGEFAAIRGSAAYRRFVEREVRYLSFAFQKPADA
jgi:SAM-dependent methyltransferase